jgi:stalled ribosome alternative rescue factor ArfA
MVSVVNRLKRRNPYAKALLDRQGIYKQRVERDRTKYTRKTKHKNREV